MNILKTLRNEKGVSTLLVVMAVAGILGTFILTLQMYVSSRARAVARIRLAYKYTFVMEDAAKIVVLSRIEFFQGCVAGRTAYKIADELSGGNPNMIRICMEDDGGNLANRCINDQACICKAPDLETDANCADNTSLDKKLWEKPGDFLKDPYDELIAINQTESDPDLAPAFEQSLFESLIPNFDNKFIAFVERMFDRDSNKRVGLLNEAVADANVSYAYTIPNPSVFGGTPTADQTENTSPYPTQANFPNGKAYTFRDCGEGRCLEIRVCVREANEQSMKTGLGQICFIQKISRSFLWPHSAAPCAAADDTTGVGGTACDVPANRDSPAVPRDKGHSNCQECPWRNRF